MKKLSFILVAISFLFGGSLVAQNSEFEAYKKAQQAEFEAFKKAQEAEFEAFKKEKQNDFEGLKTERIIFAKVILFEGTDSSFFENQRMFQQLDPIVFKEALKQKCGTCMHADTVIFRYRPSNWERGIVVKLHSELTPLPLRFEVSHVGTTFQALINVIEENFIEIKKTMKRQEMAAWSGDPNYESL